MDASLRRQFLDALFRIKRADISMPLSSGINISELVALSHIFGKHIFERCGTSNDHVNISDLHHSLHVSRPAVSQMLGSLEKRGLICREIDSADRRKITVALTEDGKEILHKAEGAHQQAFEDVIHQFGEENLRELIRLLNRLADLYEEKKNERMGRA